MKAGDKLLRLVFTSYSIHALGMSIDRRVQVPHASLMAGTLGLKAGAFVLLPCVHTDVYKGTLGLMYSFLVSIPICIYTQGESRGELTARLVCRAYRKQCSMFLPVGNMEHCIHSISSE